MSEVKKLLGAQLDRAFAEHLAESAVVRLKAIADTFDARTQWPKCSHPIRDQQQCGLLLGLWCHRVAL
eukprot:EC849057.1.p2 GENE.EC849057.1~~EC849057.1.p2  ORF type:complete len:68 (+),score=10.69 EC849057.1:204-407(+)